MNIPQLNLSKYLTKSTDKIKNTSITYLLTPPTSPDSEVPCIPILDEIKKRKLDNDNTPNKEEKKIKIDTDNKKQKLDLHLLDLYLSSGKSMEVKDVTYGLNLLCWACQCKSIEAVKKILHQGDIDINQRHGPHHITALHVAAAVDFDIGIDYLTQHPNLDLNIKDIYGLTAIHYAAKHSKNVSVNTLLEAGARSDLYDRQGKLPLHYAIRNSNIKVIRMILSKRGRNNPTFKNLIWSSFNDNNSVIEESIIMAVGNSTDMLKELLNAGALQSIESGGWWETEYLPKRDGLIGLSVEWNRFECLKYLVVNTSIPIHHQTLVQAVRQRKLDFVMYLCNQAGLKPCQNNGDNPSLLYAANHGFMDMMPYLLTNDTSVECIQQAILFTRMIAKDKIFSDLLKLHWKPSETQPQ